MPLDLKTMESWLWEAACKIRGEIDAPKYKEYILPLIFLKRLSDVFDDELNKLAEEYGSKEIAEEFVKEDHSLVRFYIPEGSRWNICTKVQSSIGERLTDAVRAISRENPNLLSVIDIVDFNATASGQRIISDERLKLLVDVLGQHRLGINDAEPDIIGRAYEYLLRKFAEGSGQSAGEFYTPKEVGILMACILSPKPGDEVYDPCCGSGGLEIKIHLRFKEIFPSDSEQPVKCYGQELQHTTYAMAKMNVFLNDMEAETKLGDSMNRPAFTNPDSSLKNFDIVIANPMWNQKDFTQDTYENDQYNRFCYGYPPSSSADWGWIQHMFASLKDNGRMAVVLDTGAVSRGSGNTGKNKERDIRKEFVDNDWIEAVVLLPENMFYNTTAPGIILVINRSNKKKGEILIINASKLFQKGRPKNYFSDEHIKVISDIYQKWKQQEDISVIINKSEAIKNDYNLSPSRYITQNGKEDILPLEDAIVLLKETEEERIEADIRLKEVLSTLGIEL